MLRGVFLLYGNFPWRFFLLLDASEHVAQLTAKQMDSEWKISHEAGGGDQRCVQVLLNEMPFLRWQVYREIMTFCEERDFVITPKTQSLVKAIPHQHWALRTRSGV